MVVNVNEGLSPVWVPNNGLLRDPLSSRNDECFRGQMCIRLFCALTNLKPLTDCCFLLPGMASHLREVLRSSQQQYQPEWTLWLGLLRFAPDLRSTSFPTPRDLLALPNGSRTLPRRSFSLRPIESFTPYQQVTPTWNPLLFQNLYPRYESKEQMIK